MFWSMRIVAETVVGILLTLLLTLLVAGIVLSIDNPDPVGAFLTDGPVLVFGLFGVALVLWVISVAIGNALHRNRRPRARVAHNLISALAVALLTVLFYAVIGIPAGGWALLIVGIAMAPALAFLVAAAIAIPVTHLVLFRPAAASARP
jgi:hypothetical protein